MELVNGMVAVSPRGDPQHEESYFGIVKCRRCWCCVALSNVMDFHSGQDLHNFDPARAVTAAQGLHPPPPEHRAATSRTRKTSRGGSGITSEMQNTTATNASLLACEFHMA